MKFVFDIDGTLCFDGRLIDQTIIDTLLQLQHDGHELIFASARPIRDLLPVLPSVFHQHTLIGANGAMISQQSSKISVIKLIHTDTYHYILKIIQKYELDYIIDDDWNYVAQLDAENAIFERLVHISWPKVVLMLQKILINILHYNIYLMQMLNI